MHLYLIYNLEYTKSGDYCRKIIDFKENINWNDVVSHPSTKKNQAVYQHFKTVKMVHCPEIIHPSVNIYYSDIEYKGITISILYFEFMNLELITPDSIKEIPTIPSVIHRHIKTMNYIYSDDINQFEYKIDNILLASLEKPRFYKVDTLESLSLVKSRIYNHQMDNIHWMLSREKECNDKIITSKIYKFDDGRIYRYEHNDFFTEETLPSLTVRGGVVIDEVGSGKSLQFICMAIIEPRLNSIILVPDHLKRQWEGEFAKHLKVPIPSNVHIMTFSEYRHYTGECDRLLIDEIHELYTNKSNDDVFRKAIDDKAKFKWALTATPFPNIHNSISNILRFLTSTYFSEEQLQKYTYNFPTIMKIFRKNTREMIKGDVIIPDLNIINEFIDFTPRERTVYDAEREAGQHTDVDTLRKICCDVLLSITNQEVSIRYKSFSSLVTTNYQSKYDTELEKLNEFTRMLENAKKTYEKVPNQHLLANIRHLENECEKQFVIVQSKKRSLDYITSNFADTPQCPYCLGDIDKESNCSIITICNHYFCAECLDSAIDYATAHGINCTCPNCKVSFNRDNVSTVSNGPVQPKYPSKIMRLIDIINGVDDKIIVYTQFDFLIQKLKVILDSEDIKSIVFNGHEDIEAMRNTDAKVLILSSGKNASGLDLTFINKIVIFEPFIGSHAHLRDIEKQIIGRIYRNGQTRQSTVYRLIIRDTIEEQIYAQ